MEAAADVKKKPCFLVNSASDLATHGEKINSLVRNGLREFQAFFRWCVEVGQVRQQIPLGLEPEATAKGLMAMEVAIRILVRGVFDDTSLRTIADQAQRLLR